VVVEVVVVVAAVVVAGTNQFRTQGGVFSNPPFLLAYGLVPDSD
jgi:hypothetical protein